MSLKPVNIRDLEVFVKYSEDSYFSYDTEHRHW